MTPFINTTEELTIRGISGSLSLILSGTEIRKQVWTSATRGKYKIQIRYDDSCNNKRPSFAILAAAWDPLERDYCFSADHSIVRSVFPEFADLIKWHLMFSDGPLHYIENTLYHVKNTDHYGLLEGEVVQITDPSGVPVWRLSRPENTTVKSHSKPQALLVEYAPVTRTGEGKKRNLDAARRSAIWLEATDEELLQPEEKLKEALLARLPQLINEFNDVINSLGFVNVS